PPRLPQPRELVGAVARAPGFVALGDLREPDPERRVLEPLHPHLLAQPAVERAEVLQALLGGRDLARLPELDQRAADVGGRDLVPRRPGAQRRLPELPARLVVPPRLLAARERAALRVEVEPV